MQHRHKLLEALQAAGIGPAQVVGDTVELTGADPVKRRCLEIEQALTRWEADGWVAIDDMDLSESDPMLMSEHFVCTVSSEGLTPERADMVGKLLTGKHDWRMPAPCPIPAKLSKWFEGEYYQRRELCWKPQPTYSMGQRSTCEEWLKRGQHSTESYSASLQSESDDDEPIEMEVGAMDDWDAVL